DSGDGNIDQLRLDFDQAVNFTDGNAGTGIFDAITVSGGIALTNGSSVDYSTVTNVMNYTFDVSGVTGTADPGETITYATGAQNTIVANAGGQEVANASNPTSVIDGAAPVLLSAVTVDSEPNGRIDEILITYSELLDFTTIALGDFGLAGYTITSAGPETAATNDENIVLALTEQTNPDTEATPTLTVTVGELEDLATSANTNAAYSAAVTDEAAPVLISAVTSDEDSDGEIDLIKVFMSELVDAGTVSTAIVAGGGAGGEDNTVDFEVTGYDITGVSVSTFQQDTIDIVIAESGSPDTGATPDIELTASSIDDQATVAISSAAYPAAATTDGAAPVLVASSSTPLDGAVDVAIGTNVVLEFSEAVAAGTGNITLVDVTGTNTDDRIIAVGDAQVGISGSTVTINPTADLLNLNNYAVNVAGTAIDDTATPANSFVGISDNTTQDFTTIGTVPTFTATWLDNSGDGNIDQLRLNFSEAVNFTDGNAGTGIFDAITVSGGIALT
ncbi:MAG: Ig-like domain-containing protein, partial [Ekhidna sp.]|nr:Ig-like domain-containing protein [Ekhidna sp.]